MAGNQRFELCNSGFGVRCSSSRACFPKNPGRGRRNRTPRILTRPPLSRRLGDHSPAPSVYSNLVPEERLALSLPERELVSEASAFAISPPGHWSTDPDSNRIRAGLQSAASIASAFSAYTKNKLWLGRKDSNLRSLGSEPSAVAAVPLPNILVAGAGIEPASLRFQGSAFT